jgi:DNA mismatch repair protein MutL
MAAETRIRVLPVHVANKIAAGEVVERPASVVKELVENAVDAGATQIDVSIAVGGRKRIAVRDNGSGMGRDDALLAIEAHATSKIREVDDIESILTMGFRGEALAAIASVSRFRLTTCPVGADAGTEVTVVGGKLQDVREVGAPAGTTIEVRDLFFNVPARRKFLRAQQTEVGHVRACFLLQALAHTHVGMSLNIDGRDVYRLAAAGELADRVRELFGGEALASLLTLDDRTGGITVRGFVSRPGAHRADRDEQYVFVNGRPTSSPVINYAIREGYHTALPKDRHPSVFLFLEMDPRGVDVNVHPTKREVRFRRPSEVRDAIIGAIQEVLAGSGVPRPRMEDVTPGPAPAPEPLHTSVQMSIEGLPAARTFPYPRLSRRAPPDAATDARLGGRGDAEAKSLEPPAAESSPAADRAESSGGSLGAPWSWCRVLGLIGGQYVLLETEDGMVVMDPGAAHERVLYERFMADVERHRVSSQHLLLPESLVLPPTDATRVRKNMDLLRSLGFGIAEFGKDALVVDALPACFATASVRTLLSELAAGFEAAGTRRGQGRWREDIVARASCRAAVKRRDRLTLEEVERLVVDLAQTAMPYTCPRGRPTLIFTSFKELDRKFGRE